jgi:hypothetical protein
MRAEKGSRLAVAVFSSALMTGAFAVNHLQADANEGCCGVQHTGSCTLDGNYLACTPGLTSCAPDGNFPTCCPADHFCAC